MLGICGALVVPLSFLELFIADWPGFTQRNLGQPVPHFYGIMIGLMQRVIYPGFMLGFIAGAILSALAWIYKREDTLICWRFAANFFWFFCYGTLLILSNVGTIHLIQLRYIQLGIQVPTMFTSSAFMLCLVINTVAVIYAAIRSITNDDVLTPRVLRNKLRRSSRL